MLYFRNIIRIYWWIDHQGDEGKGGAEKREQRKIGKKQGTMRKKGQQGGREKQGSVASMQCNKG